MGPAEATASGERPGPGTPLKACFVFCSLCVLFIRQNVKLPLFSSSFPNAKIRKTNLRVSSYLPFPPRILNIGKCSLSVDLTLKDYPMYVSNKAAALCNRSYKLFHTTRATDSTSVPLCIAQQACVIKLPRGQA